jgi:hypothetical protein
VSKLNQQIRELHSQALLFANEPYFAGGTIRHVVGNLQAKFKLEPTAAEYLQSFNENFGDVKKDLGHHKDDPFPEVAIQSSKYVYRFTDAGKGLASHAPDIVTLDGPSAQLPAFWRVAAFLQEIRQGRLLKDAADKKNKKKQLDTAKTAIGPLASSVPDMDTKLSAMHLDINKKARIGRVGT